MRRKRPFTEPDRIKERIRVIKMNKPFKQLGELPWNPLMGLGQNSPRSPQNPIGYGNKGYESIRVEHLPRGIFW